MQFFFKKIVLFSVLFLSVFMSHSCLEELITGIHEIKVVNETGFTIKGLEFVSVFQDGESKLVFSEIKSKESSESSKLLGVKTGVYQVGFTVTDGTNNEVYEKDNLLSAPLLELDVKGGKYKHTITFSGSALDGITYKKETSELSK